MTERKSTPDIQDLKAARRAGASLSPARIGRPPEPLLDRFVRKISIASGDSCWEWTGANGRYGRIGRGGTGGQHALAHRVSYELFVGAIPEGLCIDHLCRNTRCVRPSHLEAVTPQENTRRGRRANAEKTRCANGHSYTPANTYTDKEGGRHCRACGRENARRYRLERRSDAHTR